MSHTYTSPGFYVISAIGTNKAGKKAEASTRIFIAPNADNSFSLSIQPSFTFKAKGVEYTFQAISSGKIDKVVWSVNNKEVLGSLSQMSTLISEEGFYYIRAKAYARGELVAVAETTVRHTNVPIFSRLQVQSALSQYPVVASTRIVGKKNADIRLVQWNWSDGTMTSST